MKTGYFSALLALCAAGHAAGAVEFKHQTIDDKIGIGYGLAIADVNGDGKTDILLVDAKEVVWYENPSWQKHQITGALTERDHVCIAAQDLDGDGKAEIAVGAGWNPGDTVNSGAVFYLIAPEDRTQKWTPVQLPHEPTVHRMWWVKNEDGKHSLMVSPLHGRGNKNGAGDGVRLLEYLMPSNPKEEWKTSLVEGTMHMTHNLDPVQWDEDKSQEILYGGKEAVMLLNRGEAGWKSTTLISADKFPPFPGAGEVRLGKLGETRFIATIEPMHGTNAVVYTQDMLGWQRRVIDPGLSDGHAVATGSLLKNGQDQVVAGWRGKNAEGKVGIKMFAHENGQWTATVVDDNQMACEDLKVADLNGDGWPDIVAAGRATKNVKIYWNSGKK